MDAWWNSRLTGKVASILCMLHVVHPLGWPWEHISTVTIKTFFVPQAIGITTVWCSIFRRVESKEASWIEKLRVSYLLRNNCSESQRYRLIEIFLGSASQNKIINFNTFHLSDLQLWDGIQEWIQVQVCLWILSEAHCRLFDSSCRLLLLVVLSTDWPYTGLYLCQSRDPTS